MAISITTSSVSITDTQSTLTVSWTGATTGANVYIALYLRINGTTVYTKPAFLATASGSTTLNVSSVQSAIYDAATGYSLTGCVSVRAINYLDSPYTPYGDTTKTGGTLTIARRLSGDSNTTLNPYSLDAFDGTSTYNWKATWSRPHSAFRARIKIYVNATLIATYSGFSTSMSRTPSAAEITSMTSALGGVSPGNLYYVIETGFVANTTVYYTTGALTTSSVDLTKVFLVASTIAISNFNLTSATSAVPYTLTVNTSGSTHIVRLYVRVSGVDTLIKEHTGVTTSGNFSISSTERNLILNAMPTSTTATTWAWVETSKDGNTATSDSLAVATTVTLDAEFKPTLGTISWAESTGTTYVKTALGYTTGTAFFLQNKSKVTFTVPVTLSNTTTTLTSIRVQFAGTDQTTSASPVTTGFLQTSGTLSYTITATDSRGRTATSTAGSIVVRAYSNPTYSGISVFRTTTNVSTTVDLLGTYFRATYAAGATSVLALDGTTEKNWVRIRIDISPKDAGTWTNLLSTSGTALSIALTGSNYGTYSINNSYDVRFRIYDAFYDLDASGGALSDTDSFQQSLQILPFGKVSMMLGEEVMSVGKVWSQGTLDVGGEIYAIKSGGSSERLAMLSDLTTTALVTAGSTTTGALQYSGTTRTPGTLYGGTTAPSGSTRLNYDGYFYPTFLNLASSGDTATAATHYFVETGTDGFVRPKTLANVKNEIVTSAAVESAYILSEGLSSGQRWIKYSDGTLIKFGNFDLTIAIATSFGNIFLCAVQTVTYDTTVPFVGAEPVMLMGSTDGTNNDRTSNPLTSTSSLTSCKFQLWRATSTASQLWKIAWMAIGRWV